MIARLGQLAAKTDNYCLVESKLSDLKFLLLCRFHHFQDEL